MVIFLSIVLAAVAASFFSMLIYRFNNGVSLFKPATSFCPKCHHRLFPKDIIPLLSYLFLRGCCRYCGKKIDPFYFFMEISFVCLTLLGLLNGDTFWTIALYLVLTAIFFSDLRYREIPYTFTLLAGGLAVIPRLPGALAHWPNFIYVFGFYIFIIIMEKIYYRQEIFGGADILLYAVFSLYFPTVQFLLLVYLSFVLGAGFALLFLFTKLHKSRDLIPFAPFIVLAFFMVRFFGPDILRWYQGFFYG
jgi:prepilin signal peptidase PulO-like enzyme (type II secretory pathway)